MGPRTEASGAASPAQSDNGVVCPVICPQPIAITLDGMNYLYYRGYTVEDRKYDIVCGGLIETKPPLAPDESRIKEAPLDPPAPHLEDGKFPGYLTVNSGWIGVRRVYDAKQTPQRALAAQDADNVRNWYRIVFLRTLITGTYATEFFAVATPDGNRPDKHEHLVYVKSGRGHISASAQDNKDIPANARAKYNLVSSESKEAFLSTAPTDTKGIEFVERAAKLMDDIIEEAGDLQPQLPAYEWRCP